MPISAQAQRTKCILITGGAGFIGSNFTHFLYERYPNYRLIVLDVLNYAADTANLPEGAKRNGRYEFWSGDVVDREIVEKLVRRADVVVHFAAESAVTRSIRDSGPFLKSAVLGTETIAAAVTRHRGTVERFIHISSSEVYGTALRPRMSEDHPLNPRSPYAAAKCGADRLVFSYSKTYDTPAIIVRPFNIYGPRQHVEKLVPRFITSCMLGEELTVHGDGSASRDFVYVDDILRGLDVLLHAPREQVLGEVFNLGSGRHTSVLAMAHLVGELMHIESVPLAFVGDRPGQVRRHTADASKARRVLGWTTETSLEDGLERTIAWYRQHDYLWRRQLPMRHTRIMSAAGKQELL